MKIDNSLKFAWAYLLIHGKETDGKWNYYGAHWESKQSKPYTSWEEKTNSEAKKMESIRTKAESIGIDWTKSGVPEVSEQSVFRGTFTGAGECLGTLGSLVLLNGEKWLIGSTDANAAHLVETARAIMYKTESEVEKFAKKLK